MRIIDRLLTEAEDQPKDDNVFFVLLNEHDYVTFKKELSTGYVKFDHTPSFRISNHALLKDGWICVAAGGYMFVIRMVPGTADRFISVMSSQ